MFISIIIPVYNVEKYLRQCLESVLIQTYKNYEVILIDDGSTDGSSVICDEYGKLSLKIRVIHKKNGGLSDARNIGIAESKGDYIICLDSDDFWCSKDLLSKVASIAQQNEADLITFQYASYTNKLQNKKATSIQINEMDYDKKLAKLIYSGLISISAWSKAVKRQLLINNSIIFKKDLLSEDLDWSMQLYVNAKSIEVLSDVFYAYRKREGSISRTVKKKHCEDLYIMINNWAHCILSLDTSSVLKKALMDLLCYYYFITVGWSSSLAGSDQLILELRLKDMEWITKSANSKKTKLANFIFFLFGYDTAKKILYQYIIRK